MSKLSNEIWCLFHRAKRKPGGQPNHGRTPGTRTWDECKILAWGGGLKHRKYGETILKRPDELMYPQRQIIRLPHPEGLIMPDGADFDRLAVAYGLSFHRYRLEDVDLPPDLGDWQPPPRRPVEPTPPDGNFRPGAWTLDAYNV